VHEIPIDLRSGKAEASITKGQFVRLYKPIQWLAYILMESTAVSWVPGIELKWRKHAFRPVPDPTPAPGLEATTKLQ
jgi:hypothetical protein